MAQQKQIRLRTKRLQVPVSCGVGCRRGSDLEFMWLWCRLVATAPIKTPSLGTSICRRYGPKKTKDKKEKRQLKN